MIQLYAGARQYLDEADQEISARRKRLEEFSANIIKKENRHAEIELENANLSKENMVLAQRNMDLTQEVALKNRKVAPSGRSYKQARAGKRRAREMGAVLKYTPKGLDRNLGRYKMCANQKRKFIEKKDLIKDGVKPIISKTTCQLVQANTEVLL